MLSFSRPIQTDGSVCRWKRMLGLAVCVVLSGCSGENKPDIGGAGKLIGQNVTEFAQGVGTGVDQQLQVVVELSDELAEAGLSHTIAKRKVSLDEPEKTISMYLISAKSLSCTLITRAFDAEDQEIGRAACDVKFSDDDAQYVSFGFPPEMDRETVRIYRISRKSLVTESAGQ